VRLEIFTAMKIQIMVFWVMALCNDMVGYHCSTGWCCLHICPEDEGCMVLQNIGIVPHHHMVS